MLWRSPFVVACLMAVGLVAAAFLGRPALAADACLDIKFECRGSEPFWDFTTSVDGDGQKVLRFRDPENPDYQNNPIVIDACVLQGSPNDFEVTTGGPLDLVANIVGQSCTEPNDNVTDFSVTATFNQGAQTSSPRQVTGPGCCTQVD